MAGLTAGVLGALVIERDGQVLTLRRARHRALLNVLAARWPDPVTPPELAELVWDTSPPPSAVATLHAYVSLVRKELGPDAVERTERGYALGIDPDRLDRARFERLLRRGRDEARDGVPLEDLARTFRDACRSCGGADRSASSPRRRGPAPRWPGSSSCGWTGSSRWSRPSWPSVGTGRSSPSWRGWSRTTRSASSCGPT